MLVSVRSTNVPSESGAPEQMKFKEQYFCPDCRTGRGGRGLEAPVIIECCGRDSLRIVLCHLHSGPALSPLSLRKIIEFQRPGLAVPGEGRGEALE